MDTVVAPEADTSKDKDQPRDRPFNPFRYPKSAAPKALVATIVRDLEAHEAKTKARRKKRRPDDQVTFEATVSALVADLVHRAIAEPEGWLAVSLSKANLGRAGRYSAPALNKTLPALLKRMASPELALVEFEKGYRSPFGPSRQSTMRAGAALLDHIETASLDVTDFRRETGDEVIVLKSAKDGVFDGGKLIDYKDTETTRRYRDEVERINRWLAQADIEFDQMAVSGRTVDDTDRRLHRVFNNGSFDQGGRLFGSFWLPLNKRDRHRGITINGQPVVTLDYSQMAPRIVYGMAGVTPPNQDAYTIPGFEQHRDGVKKIFNSMLYSMKPLARLPQGSKALLPRHTKVGEVVDRLTNLHAPLAKLFYTGLGYRVMFTESDIMVTVLLDLIDLGIVALPVHDALVVPHGNTEEVTTVMQEVFKRVTKVEGMVEVEDA